MEEKKKEELSEEKIIKKENPFAKLLRKQKEQLNQIRKLFQKDRKESDK